MEELNEEFKELKEEFKALKEELEALKDRITKLEDVQIGEYCFNCDTIYHKYIPKCVNCEKKICYTCLIVKDNKEYCCPRRCCNKKN